MTKIKMLVLASMTIFLSAGVARAASSTLQPYGKDAQRAVQAEPMRAAPSSDCVAAQISRMNRSTIIAGGRDARTAMVIDDTCRASMTAGGDQKPYAKR